MNYSKETNEMILYFTKRRIQKLQAIIRDYRAIENKTFVQRQVMLENLKKLDIQKAKYAKLLETIRSQSI